MWARFAWTIFSVMASSATVALAANEMDGTTPSMNDETSLLQTVSKLNIDRTKKTHILKASTETRPEQKETLAQVVSTPKKLENTDQIDGSELPDQASDTEPIPAADLPSAGNAATEQVVSSSWLLAPETAQRGGTGMFGGYGTRILWQLIYGIIYYLIFVNGKPPQSNIYDNPNAEAKANFNKGPLLGCLDGGVTNCICAWACTAPHAGRTFHMTNTCSFFGGCIAMAFCPCITLFYMHACTRLEERLGGDRGKTNNPCLNGLCAAFCSCCVVAHDAGSLDLVYRQRTTCCGYDPSGV